MKNKISRIMVVKIISISLLMGTFLDNPYWYYQVLRWFICGLTGYLAYLEYEKGNKTWIWIFGIIAILFNPILPIYFDKVAWSVIDIITATIIFISLLKKTK